MLQLISECSHLELPSLPAGAIYCFPRYKVGMDSVELAKVLLESARVATVPGGAFGTSGERHLRLSFSTSEQQITEAFERMNRFFERL